MTIEPSIQLFGVKKNLKNDTFFPCHYLRLKIQINKKKEPVSAVLGHKLVKIPTHPPDLFEQIAILILP